MRAALLVVSGYSLLLLWVYRRVWWAGPRGRRFFGWDCLREYWPDVVFGLHALRHGELPLWNPYSLGGYSFYGDIQAGFLAPVNWLLWVGALGFGSEGPWLIQAKVLINLCAGLVGGLGFACSGNIGDDYAVFEPTHGSAPKYAGKYKVNPTAMLLSVKMMLDYLGETEKAEALESAIAGVIAEGKVRTYDMGGNNTTLEMAEAVAARL